MTITATRIIEIDAAHRVPDHKSKCFNIHGHRYKIEATFSGPLQKQGSEKGMVMDFSFMKEILHRIVHDKCDHATILYTNDPIFGIERLADLNEHPPKDPKGWKIHWVDFVPTAENLAHYWLNEVQEAVTNYCIKKDYYAITVARIRVYETPNCWSDAYA